MARLQKGELAWLRAVYEVVTRLPEGKHLIVVEPEKGQAVLKPEGGAVFEDLEGKRVTIVRNGLDGLARVRGNLFPKKD